MHNATMERSQQSETEPDSVDHVDTASICRPVENVDEDSESNINTNSKSCGDNDRRCRRSQLTSSWYHTSQERQSDVFISFAPSLEQYEQFIGLDETALIQAVVFIEDAYKYRSINHKVDEFSLRLYRHYYSLGVDIFRWFIIFLLHFLAFFEFPSSLTWTSDIRDRQQRLESPCGLMLTIEIVCLLLLVADIVLRGILKGKYYFIRHSWDVAGCVFLFISIVDWMVSSGMGCSELVRIRRLLRPFFILQNSTLMKKTVKCLRRTLPQVISILVMLCMHLYIFTLLGMLLFPVPQDVEPALPLTNSSGNHTIPNVTMTPIIISGDSGEGDKYFSSLLDSFMSLLILLTTANNPDISMPAYRRNRFFSIFFIVFLIIGLYCFWNMLTAVIYNQFRGYFLNSMQSSLNRRRLGVRAAFEVLRQRKADNFQGSEPLCPAPYCDGVGGYVIKSVLEKTDIPKSVMEAHLQILNEDLDNVYDAREFQQLFHQLDISIKPPEEIPVCWSEYPILRRVQRVVVHQYFSFFGIFVATCNILIVTVELASEFHESFHGRNSNLRIANFVFANYYAIEQLLKVWANGPRRYIRSKSNMFDATLTVALVIGELYSAIKFGIPFSNKEVDANQISTLWNMLRIINILIMVRLLKIIPLIKSMRVVFSVLLDLLSNLKAFAGILIVIYYVFAILGMELFDGVIKYNATESKNTTCGSYQQLEYWANNFDDFAAAIVVLWDVMVVNNWTVFLDAYKDVTSAWSYLYFIAWWIISVIVVMNLFTALVMENFIMKWDRSQHIVGELGGTFNQPIVLDTVHDMFRGLLKEPDDNELLKQLHLHQYLVLNI